MLTTKARNSLIAVAGIGLIVIDQAAKYLVYTKGFGGFLMHLRPVFGLLIFPNKDFAFSLKIPIAIIYLIYFILIALLLVWFARQQPKTLRLKIGLALVLAGAVSNIYDRVALGYVRDFIYVFWGNIFNLADLYIVGGILTLLF